MKKLNKLDIVISIYNQEKIIRKVLYSVFSNTTTPFNLILVFDGCTDKTKPLALSYIEKYKPKLLEKLIVRDAPNVYETRANNIGFRLAEEDYMITVQDDMVIKERGWERRLTYPLRKFDDVIAVSSRTAQNIEYIDESKHIYTERAARELNSLSRDIFAVRDVINRGPVAFNMKHLKTLNYLNENYAPSDLDDADLCLRAWKEKRLRCGAYWINYISRLEWGKTRAKDSTMDVSTQNRRNGLRIKNDHGDYILNQVKHDEDIFIPDSEIDYVYNIKFRERVRHYPIADTLWGFNVWYKEKIKRGFHKIREFIKGGFVFTLEKSGLIKSGEVKRLGFKKIIKNRFKRH